MTVRMGYVPRRSICHDRKSVSIPTGTETPGAILRAGTTFGKSGKKPQLFSNHVRTAKKPLLLCRCPYHSAMHRTANTVRRFVCVFTESGKVTRNSKNDRCPLWTGIHGRQFQRMAVHDKTTLCGKWERPFSTSIIPQGESKKGKEL